MIRLDDDLSYAEALELYEQKFGVQVDEQLLSGDHTQQLLQAIEAEKELLHYPVR